MPLSPSRTLLLSSLLAAALTSSLSGCSRTLSWTTLAGQGSSSTSAPPPTEQATEVQHSSEERTFVEEPAAAASPSPSSSPSRDLYAPEDEPTPSFVAQRQPLPSQPAAATSTSVRLRSSCGQTVQLVLAGRSTETTISLDPNEVESRSLDVGGRIWLLDSSQSKLSSLDVTASLRDVMVGADCLSVLSV